MRKLLQVARQGEYIAFPPKVLRVELYLSAISIHRSPPTYVGNA